VPQIAAVAQLFWADRKIDKARSWWMRAVTLDPDIGDHWAQLWKFEGQHGTAESQAAVMAKAVSSDPHHGERWQRVSKAVANAHQPIDVLLRKVVVDIDTLPPP
jgi:pre-mRNA-processing factor 6